MAVCGLARKRGIWWLGLGAAHPPQQSSTLYHAHLLVAVQKREVRLADGDVVGGGVGVQLLVPLLQELLVNALRGGGSVNRQCGQMGAEWLVVGGWWLVVGGWWLDLSCGESTPPGNRSPMPRGRPPRDSLIYAHSVDDGMVEAGSRPHMYVHTFPHRPVPLLDAVGAHDVEDAHADVVTVATPSRQPGQCHAGVRAAHAILRTACLRKGGEGGGGGHTCDSCRPLHHVPEGRGG